MYDFTGRNRLINEVAGSDCPPATRDKIIHLLGKPAYSDGGDAVETGPGRVWRTYVLPIVELAVAAGASADATNRPQVPFRPERLVIDAVVGALFNVDDITVGKDSQFAAKGFFSGLVLAPDAVGVRLACDVASTSMDVTVSVISLAAMGDDDFLACWFGTAIDK